MRYTELTEGQVRKVYVHLNEPDVIVYVSPTPAQVAHCLARSKYQTFRAHLDHRLIMWDGSDTTHDHMSDTGEFGRLNHIRLWGNHERLHVVLYGMDARYPDNPETGEMFETTRDIIDYVIASPLVAASFPQYSIGA